MMEDEEMMDSEVQLMRAERLKERLTLSTIRIAESEDLTFKYAEQLGRDLELFSQHAGRKSINVDDVILAAHRNEDVASKLRVMSQELMKSKEQQPDRKRKKPVAKTDGQQMDS